MIFCSTISLVSDLFFARIELGALLIHVVLRAHSGSLRHHGIGPVAVAAGAHDAPPARSIYCKPQPGRRDL